MSSIDLNMYTLRNECGKRGQGHDRIIVTVLVLFMFFISICDKCLGELKEDPPHLRCLDYTMNSPSDQKTVCAVPHVKGSGDDKYDLSRRMGSEECPPWKSHDETMTCIDEDIIDETMLDVQRSPETLDSMTISSAKVVLVDQFGAKGDGETDDTEAFENAWKEACTSSGSVFRVPRGKTYLVKPVTFSGPCHSALTVQVLGKIVAPKDPSVWKGLDTRLWLHFYSVDDLSVEGGGTIDGNGEEWWNKSCKINKSNPCTSAPTALTFESINNLRVRNLNVQNSQQMHMAFQKCFAVQAINVRVTAPGHSPNTDGIHVTASKYVVIKHSTIGTGDDCISIVSGSMNVRAQNVTCGPGHGISVGSLGEGNSEAEVSNIMVDGAYLHDTTNGLRIKTWQGGSGFARGITFRNVKMQNVSNPIIIDQNYCDSQKPCEKQDSAVKVSNVFYRNVEGTTPTKEAIKFECSESVGCQGIVLQNIHLVMNSGGTPTAQCENVAGSTRGTVFPAACF